MEPTFSMSMYVSYEALLEAKLKYYRGLVDKTAGVLNQKGLLFEEQVEELEEIYSELLED